jgi:hypothetical protein
LLELFLGKNSAAEDMPTYEVSTGEDCLCYMMEVEADYRKSIKLEQ